MADVVLRVAYFELISSSLSAVTHCIFQNTPSFFHQLLGSYGLTWFTKDHYFLGTPGMYINVKTEELYQGAWASLDTTWL